LTSKIINMADRLKDDTDRRLEALFRPEPVRDDGFSSRVVARVRRQMWVQRLSLPAAFVIGAIFAAKPFVQLVEYLPKLAGLVPQGVAGIVDLPLDSMPQLSTVVLAILLLVVTMMIGRLLED